MSFAPRRPLEPQVLSERIDTRLVAAGRREEWTFGVVNPPVMRASTCIFPSVAALDEASQDPHAGLFYGRHGGSTHWALEEALTALEPAAAGTKLFPSGVAALATALLAVTKTGDHVLMVDSVYQPTRGQCDKLLSHYGIETTYYDPLIGADIAALLRPNTVAVFVESPGSLTFEVQDIPAIAATVHAANPDIAVIADNTWATPVYFRALDHGVDIAMQALTKYVIGHSDAMMGALTANARWFPALQNAAYRLGQTVSPDDAFLALRGLRTLSVRLERHQRSALKVAHWLKEQPQVAKVLHPALPDCPGHALWQRDFSGASGLFSFVLTHGTRSDAARLIDDLHHFQIGFSWGGFESLALPICPEMGRTATRWHPPGPVIRLHIGLEDPADLIDDLAAGLQRFSAI